MKQKMRYLLLVGVIATLLLLVSCDTKLGHADDDHDHDGDGTPVVKRPSYPQCCIRIFSGKYPKDLINSIKDKVRVGVSHHLRNRKKSFSREIDQWVCERVRILYFIKKC